MPIRILTEEADLARFDAWVRAHPQGSLWQSSAWKKFQEHAGRETRVYAAEEGRTIVAGALVVIDRTAFNWSVWEMARGRLWGMGGGGSGCADLMNGIMNDTEKDKCLTVFVSPSEPLRPTPHALRLSKRHIHCEATRIIDLTPPDDAILAQMKPKGRYNIGVAEKNGVTVERSTDIDVFYTLLKETGGRDGFGILSKRHYEAFLRHLDGAFLFIASDTAKNPVAGLLGVVWNGMGIYYYGASKYAQRALMAPYALQWAAMRHCKAQGATKYDLLGIAPPDSPADHPWGGISSFKEKFGGTVMTYSPEQMVVVRPLAWKALQVKRMFWK